ncbi:membrane protein US8A [Equid alphaherpesvirus 8]|uniref:Membrane protein US8A n=1 Tax=Equid alphaherpesvirus 8 TaxID=39637 RepID=I1V8I9_9ALPH|nr:ORF75 gene product [Equid alphaherpesvirus 8]AFI33211.1 membrane protein US8A [Equid alphaherpesvirus 8]AUS94808.1 membrane protein US8A [Equid alphaherpesvirus 8]UER86526.1 membrane protein US8A [Equid alphaherpesvirus 8]UER86606.1 membrane protein US8A [Equid alphaherpesvirus 8]
MSRNSDNTEWFGGINYAEGMRKRKHNPVKNSTFQEYLNSRNARYPRSDSTSDSDEDYTARSKYESDVSEFKKMMDLETLPTPKAEPPIQNAEPAAAKEEPVSTTSYILNEWVAPMLGHFLAMCVYDLIFN